MPNQQSWARRFSPWWTSCCKRRKRRKQAISSSPAIANGGTCFLESIPGYTAEKGRRKSFGKTFLFSRFSGISGELCLTKNIKPDITIHRVRTELCAETLKQLQNTWGYSEEHFTGGSIHEQNRISRSNR